MPAPADVLERLVAWAEARQSVRALVLTSSRARSDGSADELSDYDVIVAAPDPAAFASEDGWAEGYGQPLVRWGDEGEILGRTTYFRSVVYEDGVRVDYTFWPAVLLERVAEQPVLPDALDVGYRVLLDKDGLTTGWAPPTYRAHAPRPASEADYRQLVEEFWWDTLICAKGLWRGDLVFAKFVLDYELKFAVLRRLLEWRVALEHDGSLTPGAYGRGLERVLPPDVWAELAATYVGADVDANWEALFRTTALFRRVATEVAETLGYAYPEAVDAGVSTKLEALRQRPPG